MSSREVDQQHKSNQFSVMGNKKSCDNHHLEIKYYCSSDKSFLCQKCIQLQTIHKSHHIKKIKDLIQQNEKEMQIEYNNLEALYKQIQNSQEQYQNILEGLQKKSINYQTIITKIETLHNQMITNKAQIDQKIQKIQHQIFPYFRDQKAFITNVINEELYLQTQIEYFFSLQSKFESIHKFQNNLKLDDIHHKIQFNEISNRQKIHQLVQGLISSLQLDSEIRMNPIKISPLNIKKESKIQARKNNMEGHYREISEQKLRKSKDLIKLFNIKSNLNIKKSMELPKSKINHSSIIQKLKKQKQVFLQNKIKFVY